MGELMKTAVDVKSIDEGAWAVYEGIIRVKLASTLTKSFREALAEALTLEREEKNDEGEISDDWWLDKRKELTGLHLIKDWGGEEMDLEISGEVIPFSPEKAVEILQDPKFLLFWNWVTFKTESPSFFRIQSSERTAKNSETS